MNNYWFTNFRTQQEGEFKWHYYLTSAKDVSRGFATRFGWGSRVPLATRVLPPGKSRAANLSRELSALTINAPNLLLVEAHPARNGDGIFLHLRELDGMPTTLTSENVISWSELQQADEVNVLEETLREGIESLPFRPYEAKFVRLMFR